MDTGIKEIVSDTSDNGKEDAKKALSALGNGYTSMMKSLRNEFNQLLRAYVDQNLESYLRSLEIDTGVVGKTGKDAFELIARSAAIRDWFDVDGIKQKICKNSDYRQALVSFVVSLHGMWLFLWDENSSTYRFPPLEQENVEEMVGELVRFGDGVKYKQEVQNEVKSLIPGYALSPGQGSVGLSLRIGNECTVCIRNTILDARGAVALEDHVLRNLSYCGVSVAEESSIENATRYKMMPIAHLGAFFPAAGAWHGEDSLCCRSKNDTKRERLDRDQNLCCFAGVMQSFLKDTARFHIVGFFQHLGSICYRQRVAQIMERGVGGGADLQARIKYLINSIQSGGAGGGEGQNLLSWTSVSAVTMWHLQNEDHRAAEGGSAPEKGITYYQPDGSRLLALDSAVARQFDKTRDLSDDKASREIKIFELLQQEGFGEILPNDGGQSDNMPLIIVEANDPEMTEMHELFGLPSDVAKQQFVIAIRGLDNDEKEKLAGELCRFWSAVRAVLPRSELFLLESTSPKESISDVFSAYVAGEKQRSFLCTYIVELCKNKLTGDSEDARPSGLIIQDKYLREQIKEQLKKLSGYGEKIKGMWLLQDDAFAWEAGAANRGLENLEKRVQEELGVTATDVGSDYGSRRTMERLVCGAIRWMHMQDDDSEKEMVIRLSELSGDMPQDYPNDAGVSGDSHVIIRGEFRDAADDEEGFDVINYGGAAAFSFPRIQQLWATERQASEYREHRFGFKKGSSPLDLVVIRKAIAEVAFEYVVTFKSSKQTDDSQQISFFLTSTGKNSFKKSTVLWSYLSSESKNTFLKEKSILHNLQTWECAQRLMNLFSSEDVCAKEPSKTRPVLVSLDSRGEWLVHPCEQKLCSNPHSNKGCVVHSHRDQLFENLLKSKFDEHFLLQQHGLCQNLFVPLFHEDKCVALLLFSGSQREFDYSGRILPSSGQRSLIDFASHYIQSLVQQECMRQEQLESVEAVGASFSHEMKNLLLGPQAEFERLGGSKRNIEAMKTALMITGGINRAYKGLPELASIYPDTMSVGSFVRYSVKSIMEEERFVSWGASVKDNYSRELISISISPDAEAAILEYDSGFPRETFHLILREVLNNAAKYCDYYYGPQAQSSINDPYGIKVFIEMATVGIGDAVKVKVENGLLAYDEIQTRILRAKDLCRLKNLNSDNQKAMQRELKKLSSGQGNRFIAKLLLAQYDKNYVEEYLTAQMMSKEKRYHWSFLFSY